MKRIDVVKKRDGWAGESCGRIVPGEDQGRSGEEDRCLLEEGSRAR